MVKDSIHCACCILFYLCFFAALREHMTCHAQNFQGQPDLKPGPPGTGLRMAEETDNATQVAVENFGEARPPFVSNEQWQEWNLKYGFSPLGEFCDSCLTVPGKCVRPHEQCQLYCGDDCRGHGKEFTKKVLCKWCREARGERCRDWRSCRDKCGTDCVHEVYARKAMLDYERHVNDTIARGEKKYIASLRQIVEDAMQDVNGDEETRKELEEQMKQFAAAAGVYFPLSDEL
ncbi:hypothetical protein BESB_003480 [Besnoitia besnoiti]|uniref:TNFR-Cys domain-containing protein n=1 Tax=Besnoitia besnoiti TaxID=94643 RepID=A0A2A9MPL9_BESBE|nr:hypothetical protein BESB_003480 [Besnoitia besnoiti]PFH38007.1 hypothetical protein BESB_003480 [Besnoitia besnoiti]